MSSRAYCRALRSPRLSYRGMRRSTFPFRKHMYEACNTRISCQMLQPIQPVQIRLSWLRLLEKASPGNLNGSLQLYNLIHKVRQLIIWMNSVNRVGPKIWFYSGFVTTQYGKALLFAHRVSLCRLRACMQCF